MLRACGWYIFVQVEVIVNWSLSTTQIIIVRQIIHYDGTVR